MYCNVLRINGVLLMLRNVNVWRNVMCNDVLLA